MRKLKRTLSLAVALIMLGALLTVPMATANVTGISLNNIEIDAAGLLAARTDDGLDLATNAIPNADAIEVTPADSTFVFGDDATHTIRFAKAADADAAAALDLTAANFPETPVANFFPVEVGQSLVISIWDVGTDEIPCPDAPDVCECGPPADCPAADEIAPAPVADQRFIINIQEIERADIALCLATESLIGDIPAGQRVFVRRYNNPAPARLPVWRELAAPFNVTRLINRAGTLEAIFATTAPDRDPSLTAAQFTIADRAANIQRPTFATTNTFVDYTGDNFHSEFGNRFGTDIGVTISGISNTMEFKISTDDEWVSATGGDIVLPVGWTQYDLWVRTAAVPARAAANAYVCSTCEPLPTDERPDDCDDCRAAVTAVANYTAGSRTQRLRVAAVVRPPNPRVDFVRGTVRYNRNWEFWNADRTGGAGWSDFPDANRFTVDAVMGSEITLRTKTNGRRPPSAAVTLRINDNGEGFTIKTEIGNDDIRYTEANIEHLAIVGNRLLSGGGFPAVEHTTQMSIGNVVIGGNIISGSDVGTHGSLTLDSGARWRRGAPRINRRDGHLLGATAIRVAGDRHYRLFAGDPMAIRAITGNNNVLEAIYGAVWRPIGQRPPVDDDVLADMIRAITETDFYAWYINNIAIDGSFITDEATIVSRIQTAFSVTAMTDILAGDSGEFGGHTDVEDTDLYAFSVVATPGSFRAPIAAIPSVGPGVPAVPGVTGAIQVTIFITFNLDVVEYAVHDVILPY